MNGRVAALAAATMALVAACGSAAPPTGAPVPPSVGATTVPAVAPTTPAAPAPTTPPAAPPPTNVGPAPATIPALDTPAPSWRFPPGTPVDPSRVAALQSALGGPIVVGTDPMHSWTFTGPGTPFDADALWRATGADPHALQVTTDGATITARAPLGGVYSPLATVVVTGQGLRVISASGYLADPVAGPEVPRVGTAAATERLAAGAGGGALSPSSPGAPVPSLAPQPPIAANPSIPVPGVCTKSEAGTCAPPAEPPTGPGPASAAATPTGVAPALVAFPAAGGGERLLPAYAFSLAGSTRTVPAVDAGVLFTGLTEAQASAEAARQGWAYRVVARDGHDLLVTQDYSPARVNVSVTGGTVDKATFG